MAAQERVISRFNYIGSLHILKTLRAILSNVAKGKTILLLFLKHKREPNDIRLPFAISLFSL
jgi:hypothetical protein